MARGLFFDDFLGFTGSDSSELEDEDDDCAGDLFFDDLLGCLLDPFCTTVPEDEDDVSRSEESTKLDSEDAIGVVGV